MGQRTRASIVTQGLTLAGDLSLTLLANAWLNDEVFVLNTGWPWPWLMRRQADISLGQGVTSLNFGAGAGGVTQRVKRIFDPMWMRTSDYSYRGRPRIRPLIGGELNDDETIQNPTTITADPTEFKVRGNGTFGQWQLIPIPVPNKAYLLTLDYWLIPDNLDETAGGDASIYEYPNDRTLVQAVIVRALQHMSAGSEDEAIIQRYTSELQVYDSMIVNDRSRFGEVAGTNDQLQLDTSTFSNTGWSTPNFKTR